MNIVTRVNYLNIKFCWLGGFAVLGFFWGARLFIVSRVFLSIALNPKRPGLPKRKSPQERQKQLVNARFQKLLRLSHDMPKINACKQKVQRDHPDWSDEKVWEEVWKRLKPKRRSPQ